jgi:MFS family permease
MLNDVYESFGTQGPNAVAGQAAVTRRFLDVRVSATVVLLGLTSLLTDISTEMVSAVLPLYLVLHLGFTPLHFGVVDGLYHGVTALVRVAGGLVADRHRRYKEVAGVGYALSAACKLGLWSAGSAWLPTLGFLLLDRTGKGIRTAPRDALITLSSPPARLAEAFGVHRALDTAGALLGPIVAFALLGLVPGAYDVIFVVSFCLAIVGLGILLFFVQNAPRPAEPTAAAISLRAAGGLLRRPGVRGVVIAGGLLSVATVSDAFIYLTFQRRALMDPQYFPLLFVGTALIYLLLAVPAGRLADRAGRRRMFLLGHVLLGGVYLLLLRSEPGAGELAACLVLLGGYYASTDGVLMAIASSRLPARLLTSGLAVLTTVTALGRLLASMTYGALWTWWGPEATLTVFALGLLAAIVGAGIVVGPTPREATA